MSKNYTNVSNVKVIKTTLADAYKHLEEVKFDLKKELKKYWDTSLNISFLSVKIENDICVVELNSSTCDFTIKYNLKNQSKKFVKTSSLNFNDVAVIMAGLEYAFDKVYGKSLMCYNESFSTKTL